MKTATEFSQNNTEESDLEFTKENHIRACPSCGFMSIKEMPGGRDATCKNCGYKDPCCSD